MNTPTISTFGASGYRFTWSVERIEIILDNFRESSRDGMKAEVTVISSRIAGHQVLIIDDVNLKSSRSRNELVSQLTKFDNGLDWLSFLQCACITAIMRHREGEPCLLLSEGAIVRPAHFRLNPLVYEKQPSVIYAPGGSGKSYFVMLCGLLVAKGGYFDVNRANGEVVHSRLCAVPGNVLYLDWESEWDLLASRRKKLTSGHPELQQADLHYLRMHRSLADDVRKVHQHVKRYNVDLLIVDSLAPACGGEAISAETAIRYHSALRSLEVSSLAVAHVAKDQNGEAKSIYGSVFFLNLARSVWQLQGQQDQGSNIKRITLSHTKVNEGPLQPTLGFSLTFDHDTVSVAPLDPDGIADVNLDRTAVQRIQQAMKEGCRTVASISKQTGLADDTVRARLNGGKGCWCSKSENKEWLLASSN
jgi:hypothetical protein